MLRAKNIIYGFCTFTNPPKNKYLISLYRSETLNVVAVFPTSRKRSGSLSPKHGKNYRGQDIVSYVFEANRCIGKKYGSDEVVGVLSDEEYINLIYAFSKSPLTPRKYIAIFEKILKRYL